MDRKTHDLLSNFLIEQHECQTMTVDPDDQEAIVRELSELEGMYWSESPVEVDRQTLRYRKLLAALDNLDLLEDRYLNCKHHFLRLMVAEHYAEALSKISDVKILKERSKSAHPALRLFLVERFEELLPNALDGISENAIPSWFIWLLRQPAEMLDLLSATSCTLLRNKVEGLLRHQGG